MKEISVKIEKLKNSNVYVATSDDLPELFVMGESVDQVISDIPDVIELIAEARSSKKNKGWVQ